MLRPGGSLGLLDLQSDGPAGAIPHALVREPVLDSRALSGPLQAAGLGDVRTRHPGSQPGRAIATLTARKAF